MSKLVHSYEPTMELIALRSDYEERGEDCFESWAADGISDKTVREVLGPKVANAFALWIYWNLK